MKPPATDSPLVAEVRRRRHELSARYGDDLQQYAAHLREIEAQYQTLLVSQVKVVPGPQTEVPAPAQPQPGDDPRRTA